MEVSYSAWSSVADESRVVGGESFSFLFDRRYTNRLNRMSRVFFEAYVKAATELAAEEDRFPSLSEIESRMESGAIYAYKDRLMRTTDFFDEVKISGISYLIPKAKRFIDETGTYSDIILDFDQGAVTLPKRKKVNRAEDAEEPDFEETVKEEEEVEVEVEEEEEVEEVLLEATGEVPEEEAEPKITEERPLEVGDGPMTDLVVTEAVLTSQKGLFEKIDAKSGLMVLGLAIVLVVIAFSGSHIWSPTPPAPTPTPAPPSVCYTTYLTNESESVYLNLDVSNPLGLDSGIEMTLPPDIDRSISATGGVVTILYSNGTMIQLYSNNDAGISICLAEAFESVPVTFNLTAPTEFDTSLTVHEEDYQVVRRKGTISLICNCTEDRLKFEQIYNEKSVSGGGSAQKESSDNDTKSD
ncbi:MAG: hypothetical protein D4Q77_03305 [Methanothrix sp.]|nr:MAG: hypothetical protein D4Q77_03305 [Methanothrix sp.]